MVKIDRVEKLHSIHHHLCLSLSVCLIHHCHCQWLYWKIAENQLCCEHVKSLDNSLTTSSSLQS